MIGFTNPGINERPNPVALNRTEMPSVLAEVGFINTAADNMLFNERFYDAAQAIADGVPEIIRG